MKLTVRDVARMLKVTESKVYRWVGEHDLPAEEINGQYRFNQAELLEWATVRKLEMSPSFFESTKTSAPPRLDEALQRGGILYGVKGADKETVLRAVVQAMPLPAEVDRDFLWQVFLSREAMGSTAIGEGIALPHPRYPAVLPVKEPFITLCFLEQAIAYAPSGQQRVHTLFALVSPTVRVHLGLLARLAFALRDEEFRGLVQRKSAGDKILGQARRLEEMLQQSGSAGQAEAK